MSASIWNPDSQIITIDAESSNLSQVFTAAGGQTLFTLTSFEYVLASGSIAVFRNGQRLLLGVDWEETSTTSITLLGITLATGEVIEVVAVLGATAANTILAQASADAAAISAADAAASAALITPANFATAAQGALADTAVQPADITNMLETSDIGSSVQAYDADTAKTDVAQNFTLPQRSALLTDNDGNFDLAAKQNFKCTTAAGLTLTFTNQANGLSGSVYFINASNHAIAAHANTKLTTSDLTKLSATGTYRIDYMTDGTNALCSVVGPYL